MPSSCHAICSGSQGLAPANSCCFFLPESHQKMQENWIICVCVYIYIGIYIYIECTCDNVSTYIQLGYNRDSMGIKRRYNIPMGPLHRGYAGDFQKTISMTIASCRGLTRPYHWNILISWWPKCTLFDSNSNLCCSILGCFVCLNDFIFVFLVQFECLFDAVNPQFHLCSFWQFPNDVLTSEK